MWPFGKSQPSQQTSTGNSSRHPREAKPSETEGGIGGFVGKWLSKPDPDKIKALQQKGGASSSQEEIPLSDDELAFMDALANRHPFEGKPTGKPGQNNTAALPDITAAPITDETLDLANPLAEELVEEAHDQTMSAQAFAEETAEPSFICQEAETPAAETSHFETIHETVILTDKPPTNMLSPDETQSIVNDLFPETVAAVSPTEACPAPVASETCEPSTQPTAIDSTEVFENLFNPKSEEPVTTSPELAYTEAMLEVSEIHETDILAKPEMLDNVSLESLLSTFNATREQASNTSATSKPPESPVLQHAQPMAENFPPPVPENLSPSCSSDTISPVATMSTASEEIFLAADPALEVTQTPSNTLDELFEESDFSQNVGDSLFEMNIGTADLFSDFSNASERSFEDVLTSNPTDDVPATNNAADLFEADTFELEGAEGMCDDTGETFENKIFENPAFENPTFELGSAPNADPTDSDPTDSDPEAEDGYTFTLGGDALETAPEVLASSTVNPTQTTPAEKQDNDMYGLYSPDTFTFENLFTPAETTAEENGPSLSSGSTEKNFNLQPDALAETLELPETLNTENTLNTVIHSDNEACAETTLSDLDLYPGTLSAEAAFSTHPTENPGPPDSFEIIAAEAETEPVADADMADSSDDGWDDDWEASEVYNFDSTDAQKGTGQATDFELGSPLINAMQAETADAFELRDPPQEAETISLNPLDILKLMEMEEDNSLEPIYDNFQTYEAENPMRKPAAYTPSIASRVPEEKPEKDEESTVFEIAPAETPTQNTANTTPSPFLPTAPATSEAPAPQKQTEQKSGKKPSSPSEAIEAFETRVLIEELQFTQNSLNNLVNTYFSRQQA